MAATDKTSAQQIVRNPRILSGEPIIAGTRVSVRAVVVSWHYEPDLDRMREAYPGVTPEGIRAALAYYEQHRAEIDRYIAANEAELD